jgi:hypothetical protein
MRVDALESNMQSQEPTVGEGSYFKNESLFPYVGDPPTFMNVYGGSDFAVTSNGGDWTVHVVIGIDPKGSMFLLDVWRQQTSSAVWIDSLCDLVIKHKPSWLAFETGQIKAGLDPFIRARAIERRAYTNTVVFPTRGEGLCRHL